VNTFVIVMACAWAASGFFAAGAATATALELNRQKKWTRGEVLFTVVAMLVFGPLGAMIFLMAVFEEIESQKAERV